MAQPVYKVRKVLRAQLEQMVLMEQMVPSEQPVQMEQTELMV
jgi:hypothetical protein